MLLLAKHIAQSAKVGGKPIVSNGGGGGGLGWRSIYSIQGSKMDEELEDAINELMSKYREEVRVILNGDEQLIDSIDGIFLISLVLERQGEDVEPVNDDFIDGFCVGLLHAGKVENALKADRLKQLIKAARALI